MSTETKAVEPVDAEAAAVEREVIAEDPAPSTSTAKMMADEIVKNLFDTKNFEPIYASDEEEFEDFTEDDKADKPELFLTDEDLDRIFVTMTEADKKHYLQLKEFHLAQYFQRGRIIPLSDVIKGVMDSIESGTSMV